MQLFATFVKNKCNSFNFLVQQKLALVITILLLGEIASITHSLIGTVTSQFGPFLT